MIRNYMQGYSLCLVHTGQSERFEKSSCRGILKRQMLFTNHGKKHSVFEKLVKTLSAVERGGYRMFAPGIVTCAGGEKQCLEYDPEEIHTS